MRLRLISWLPQYKALIFFLTTVVGYLLLPVDARCQYQQDQESMSIHELFAEVGRRVPAFGGMFVDEAKDTLYVYMVPGQAGDALTVDRAITEVLGYLRPPEHRLETIAGQFTFLQLKEWQDRMSPEMLAIPGAVSTCVDDSKNQSTVGIEGMDLVPVVQAELAASGIPNEAVNIEQTPPTTPAKTLQDYWRGESGPFGGVQIQGTRDEIPAGLCTLGFDALRADGVRGFVTASHCTVHWEGSDGDGTVFSQPSTKFDLPSVVGVVPPGGDPCFWPTSSCPAPGGAKCPRGRRCRYSDSAFVKFMDIGVYPKIAMPDGLGSINWNGNNVFYVVETGVRKVCKIPGCTVQKVGRTTGWTQGHIREVGCSWNVGKRTYLEQGVVEMDANGVLAGDSGSPVFGIIEPGFVSLVGILSGSNGGGKPEKCPQYGLQCLMVYSPFENIIKKSELGPMKVCGVPQC